MAHELDRFVARVKDRAGQTDTEAVEQAVRATLRTLGSHLGGVPPALHDVLPRPLRPELAAGANGEALRPAELYPQVAERADVRVGVALELVLSTIAELAAAVGEPALEVLRTSLPPAWAALVPTHLEPQVRESSRPSPAARFEGSGMYKLPEGSGAHRLTDGSGAHKLNEGSGAHRLNEGSGTHKLNEGSGTHKLNEGSGTHKLNEGSGTHKLNEGSGAHKLAGGRPGSARSLADAQPPAGRADSNADSDDPSPDRLAAAEDEDDTLGQGRPGRKRRTLIPTE
jgi:hypothetical protein